MTTQAMTTQVRTVRDLLDKSKAQIRLALPRHLDADRLMRVAMTSIQKTPALAECTPVSLVAAVMQAAQLGLEPDAVLGHAYLVPYKRKVGNRYQMEAQLIAGYKGLLSLMRRSGDVLAVEAHVVYADDLFEYSVTHEGTSLKHVPSKTSDRRDVDILAAYMVAKFKGGGYHVEVMFRNEIDAVRSKSKAGNYGPWVDHFAQMAKKTVIRRAANYLPLATEVQRALAAEEASELGIDSPTIELELDRDGVASNEQSATDATTSKLDAIAAESSTTAVCECGATIPNGSNACVDCGLVVGDEPPTD